MTGSWGVCEKKGLWKCDFPRGTSSVFAPSWILICCFLLRQCGESAGGADPPPQPCRRHSQDVFLRPTPGSVHNAHLLNSPNHVRGRSGGSASFNLLRFQVCPLFCRLEILLQLLIKTRLVFPMEMTLIIMYYKSQKNQVRLQRRKNCTSWAEPPPRQMDCWRFWPSLNCAARQKSFRNKRAGPLAGVCPYKVLKLLQACKTIVAAVWMRQRWQCYQNWTVAEQLFTRRLPQLQTEASCW